MIVSLPNLHILTNTVYLDINTQTAMKRYKTQNVDFTNFEFNSLKGSTNRNWFARHTALSQSKHGFMRTQRKSQSNQPICVRNRGRKQENGFAPFFFPEVHSNQTS
ncbi:hypothetical protein BaRGS_00029641 [Batillaria attramentaria]|uniref:Uncharacterized protein n=1 Tax=Batillaria attramentaria TaxID=370345 RepID=A0ABD0JWA1_9CAEN